MTTVLAVYNSDGCVGRCDAKCHDAKPGAPCDCICGGANHGAGLAIAMANNREALGLRPEDLEAFAKAHGYSAEDLRVIDRVKTPGTARARREAERALKVTRDLFSCEGV